MQNIFGIPGIHQDKTLQSENMAKHYQQPGYVEYWLYGQALLRQPLILNSFNPHHSFKMWLLSPFLRLGNWGLDRLGKLVKVTAVHLVRLEVKPILFITILSGLCGKIRSLLFSVMNTPVNIMSWKYLSIIVHQEATGTEGLTLTLFFVSSPVMNLPKLLRNRSAELSCEQEKPASGGVAHRAGQKDNPVKGNIVTVLFTRGRYETTEGPAPEKQVTRNLNHSCCHKPQVLKESQGHPVTESPKMQRSHLTGW